MSGVYFNDEVIRETSPCTSRGGYVQDEIYSRIDGALSSGQGDLHWEKFRRYFHVACEHGCDASQFRDGSAGLPVRGKILAMRGEFHRQGCGIVP